MQNGYGKKINLLEYIIISLIFLILFVVPVLFTKINGVISWTHVEKIWLDQILLIPLFFINHWFLLPKVLFRKKTVGYIVSITMIIGLFCFVYFWQDEISHKRPDNQYRIEMHQPEPIPPYAHLLIYSLLLIGVDTGLLYSKKWYDAEQTKQILEKENARIQLDILRNQISPHFFMNTLNNIYALIDSDTAKAKEVVIKLSKLMRYMLYENGSGKVLMSKEFEFIKSYVDLMKLRYTDELKLTLILPDTYDDVPIPPMLFVSYIENAFKYGVSYQKESFINIAFEIKGEQLTFTCLNTKHVEEEKQQGGLGMKNSQERLRMMLGDQYALTVNDTDKLFQVTLTILLS